MVMALTHQIRQFLTLEFIFVTNNDGDTEKARLQDLLGDIFA